MTQRWAISYRPNQFKKVLGQVAVVNFFKAVLGRYYLEGGELPVGFLFGGRSGVGKTTLARIIGASLNCDKRSGVEPCGECASCQRIMSGEGSVIEVDASFFGLVDNIRELRDQLQMYSVSAYKVVILDEAHMMSKESFNVLLKLLEEPPAKTLFILCTTESEKVLETVRSRLLEFRFVAIPQNVVFAYLDKLLKRENVQCDSSIYVRLYRLSDDNLRNVIVSMEQLALLGKGKVDKDLVVKTFGDIFVFEKILDGIKVGDYGRVIELYRTYNTFYTDFVRFLNGFLRIAGDYFLAAILKGSSDVLFYGTLFRAIYRFQQTAVSLKGEAAANLFFHSIIMEVAGEIKTSAAVVEILNEGVLTEEEALDLLMVDKS